MESGGISNAARILCLRKRKAFTCCTGVGEGNEIESVGGGWGDLSIAESGFRSNITWLHYLDSKRVMVVSKMAIVTASFMMLMEPRLCWAFMSASSTPSHQRLKRDCETRQFERSSSGRRFNSFTARLDSSPAAALCSVKEAPRSEILDALFGASYEERIELGREAQGFLTTDALAARTLVPPRELTYGEYDLDFFLSLVTECLTVRAGGQGSEAVESDTRSLVFGDIGSGCGRLVVAQALTWPWRACRGVEIVPSLNRMGEEALQAADRMAKEGRTTISPDARRLLQTMAPCSLSQGDVNGDDVDISDIDVLFCYSSSFPAFGDLLTEFSYTLGHKLRPGAQVITTDRRLVSDGPWEFELLRELEGRNSETGGTSIGYIWRVVKSAL